MIRVLILGGAGMLGHKVWQQFRNRFDAFTTVRSVRRLPLFDDTRVITGVDVADIDAVARAFARVRPDVVVNCVGIIKQLSAVHDPIATITVNALFPHRLHVLCRATGARFVHVSTDCVFAGTRGGYREEDVPDATDLYGRTKLLGEVTDGGGLTLRTSIIGRELTGSTGLLEWFLRHRGRSVRGYTRAVFSGLTTTALAGLLAEIIEHHPTLDGLYHVAAAPISKFDVLSMVNERMHAGISIQPTEAPVIDRSLDGTRLRGATGIAVPDWSTMIAELALDPTPYEEWRRTVVP